MMATGSNRISIPVDWIASLSLPKTPSALTVNDLRRLRFYAAWATIAGFRGQRGSEHERPGGLDGVSSSLVRYAHTVGGRESCPAPATGRLEAVEQTTETASSSPRVLDVADATLARVAVGTDHRETGHGRALASPGLSALLVVEISTTQTRASSHRTGSQGFDQANV